MKKIVIMVLATALLSSCGLYNKYERPEVNTKGLVRDAVSLTDTLAVKDTTSFGNMPWRSVFTDPQLQSLIERGLANNPDLLNAALNVKMVNEALKVAKLAFIPSLSFTPQGTIASFDGAPATKSYSLPVTASWNVDLFGNLLNQKRSAQMQLLATQDYQTVVQRHCQSLLHVAHARPSERDHRGYDHSYQRYVGHDEAADEPGTRPLYQRAERRGCLL